MENLPRTSPIAAPVPEDGALALANPSLPAAERSQSGIWSLDGDRLVVVEDFADGPAVVLVRSEQVLVLAVELPPIATTARRRAALPFAVEDRIADPLDDVHVALGAEVAPNVWLAGIVRHDLMRQWILRLAEAGIERAVLVPDALSLPVPGAESWSVDLAGNRAMVRAPDATGFAMPLSLLGPAWNAAGRPECVAYGDPLPPDMHGARVALEEQPLALRLLAPALDLRQGRYALPRRRTDPLWKRLAVVAAMGALAHGAIAAADTLALQRIARARAAEVRVLAGTLQPSLMIGPSLGTTLADLTPDGAGAQPSQFLSLLARVGGGLATLPRPVGWRSLAFDRNAGTLTLEVEADDIAGLQGVAQALTSAGLSAQPGTASTDQGRAVGAFVVLAK